jgi:hypothetical protein
MISLATFMGGGAESVVPAHVRLLANAARVQHLTPSSNRNIIMPDATLLEVGGPTFYIANSSVARTLFIYDDQLALIDTIPPSTGAILALVENDTAAGNWIFAERL